MYTSFRMSPVVLVTGGTGLVGKAIEAVASQFEGYSYYYASSKDADLRDAVSTAALFDRVQPAAVIHLAARVGGLFANMADNLGFFEDNLAINTNVVKNCHRLKIERAVFCLSTCVFPSDAPLPIKEESLHMGPPHFSNEGYAYSKRMLECLVRYYRNAFNYTNWVCVIPTNIYGPHDNFNLKDAHVIPALIHKAVISKEEGKALVVAGSGTPLRQFIYSNDLARIILILLLRNGAHKHPAVICCDMECEISINYVAGKIIAAVGNEEGLVNDASKADGIFRKPASNEKLMELLPEGFKFTPFDQGIALAVDWFIKNSKSARI